MNDNRILVTGATGFVGRALCDALGKKYLVRGTVRRLGEYRYPEGVEFVHGDLASSFDWTSALTGVTSVVHCAARVHVMHEQSVNPLAEFRRVNVDGTMRLARQAGQLGIKRFVFLSSIGVHGTETTERPYRSDDLPAPHSPYAISKLEAELALKQLADETGLEVVIIRPPLVYGRGAPGNFASLIRILSAGIPLPLASITGNKRSLVFVENLTDLIECCLVHHAAANQTFLVSDGETLSTAALLRRMGDALGRPARLFPVPVQLIQLGAMLLRKREMLQRLCCSLEVDIRKTRELLGWSPPISVDEGLRRTATRWLAV